MVIAQMLPRSCGELERKHQQIDREQLRPAHELLTLQESSAGWSQAGELLTHEAFLAQLRRADVVHLYGAAAPPPLLTSVSTPYVAAATPHRGRWPWQRPRTPAVLLTGGDTLPRAVAEEYFHDGEEPTRGEIVAIGSRSSTAESKQLAQLTIPRIARLRSDVRWQLFDLAPTPRQLRALSLWVDCSNDETSDACTPEAIVTGLPIVATRTQRNEILLDRGAAALLVRPGDPNELAHAVLTALFKPEVIASRVEAARALASTFHPRKRAALLEAIYRRAVA